MKSNNHKTSYVQSRTIIFEKQEEQQHSQMVLFYIMPTTLLHVMQLAENRTLQRKLNFLYNTHRLSLDTKVTNVSTKYICSSNKILHLNLEEKRKEQKEI